MWIVGPDSAGGSGRVGSSVAATDNAKTDAQSDNMTAWHALLQQDVSPEPLWSVPPTQ